MIQNYLTVGLRNLLRYKIYSCINILGLAVGIACSILILLFVQDELQYDRFHQKADDTYRILTVGRYPVVPVPLHAVLASDFPEVESVTSFSRSSKTLRLGDEYSIEKRVFYADEGFFDVFSLSFLSGNPKTALAAPTSVILTRSTAHRYFADQNPLEQTLEVNDGTLLQVTAVVEDLPAQSHFHFDFIVPLSTNPRVEQRRTQWGSITLRTYLTLKPGTDPALLETKLAEFLKNNIKGGRSSKDKQLPYILQPLTDIHLHSHLELELQPNGDMLHIYIFSASALFILILACINFVNLATARSTGRAREVGIRKVLGSHRVQLIRQFFCESFLYVALSVVLGLGISELALPALNNLADKNLIMASLLQPSILASLFGIITLVSLLSGSYPAWYLSSFWPTQALKGHLTSGKDGLRNALVVTQFCISITMLVCMLVVREQLHYAQNIKLGFDKEHVLVIRGASALSDQVKTFRDQLSALPQVSSAALTQTLPGRFYDTTMFEPEQPANFKSKSLSFFTFDEHTLETLGLNLVAGRNFTAEETSGYLINQAMATALGWENPVGKAFNRRGRKNGTIIGVVENFHFESFRHELKPLVMPYLWYPALLAVRLHPGDMLQTIDNIKQVWTQFVPNRPFEYSFLDDDYSQIYKGEMRVARVFEIFSTLAIFIACLGLFGLASFTTEQRTKEIGIRKVLGATVPNIILMLSKNFVRLIIFAFFIATPLAYHLMNLWLRDFAYHIDISWWIFALAGCLALGTGLLTVSYQALKAAKASPITALRCE